MPLVIPVFGNSHFYQFVDNVGSLDFPYWLKSERWVQDFFWALVRVTHFTKVRNFQEGFFKRGFLPFLSADYLITIKPVKPN
jgi:hypothetical protein